MDEDVTKPRRVCAVLWLGVLATALGGFVSPMLYITAFLGAFMMMVMTVMTSRIRRDEQLRHPLAYRLAAGTLLVVTLVGVAIGLWPGARDTSQLLAVLFGIVALLAYRAFVARGPSHAMFVVAVTMFLWIPFAFLSLLGCHRPGYVTPWSTTASLQVLQIMVLMLPVLAVAALLAFAPRKPGELPHAVLVQ
jgi:hypothetical protein